MDRDTFKVRQVLAQNLKGLMQAKSGPSTQTELAARAGVAQATIGRILRCEAAATVETISQLAAAYELEAWQLLVAGMDPGNPPVLMPVSAREKELYARLARVAHEITELQPPEYKTNRK